MSMARGTILAVLAVAGVALAHPAQAQTVEELLPACALSLSDQPPADGAEAFREAYCLAAVGIISDLSQVFDGNLVFCAPDDANSTVLIRALINFAEENPNLMDEQFTFGALIAFNVLWPCEDE